MTINELSKLSAIQSEIHLIKREIENTDLKFMQDRVTGSSREFPYCKRSFTVQGYDYDSYYCKLNRLQKKLERKLDELMDEKDRILDYINTVDDSIMRQILMLKYINGMTWEQIGREIGYSSRSIRRKHSQFFREEN